MTFLPVAADSKFASIAAIVARLRGHHTSA